MIWINGAVSFNFFVIFVILEFWLTTTSQPRLTSMRDNAPISIAYAFGSIVYNLHEQVWSPCSLQVTPLKSSASLFFHFLFDSPTPTAVIIDVWLEDSFAGKGN